MKVSDLMLYDWVYDKVKGRYVPRYATSRLFKAGD